MDILYRVFYDHGFASLLLREITDEKISVGFVAESVYGTIRNRSLLEYQWKDLVKKTRGKTEVLLDLACYELFFMDTPDYAVLDAANRLAPSKDRAFVNAVLRKVVQRGMRTSDDLSVMYSMPAWIISLWKAHYGEERTLSFLKSFNGRGSVTGRWNPLKGKREDLEDASSYTWLDEYCFTCEKPVQNTEDFKAGKVLIQNPSSVLPALLADVKPGMHVLDTCASPGTKTQMMAVLMGNEGSILACDLHEHRVGLIENLMKRTGVSIVQAQCADATVYREEERELYDRVLCDVPCSGLGDLSHKPEIRWHLSDRDMDELCALQEKILNTSCQYVKPGGKLVYSTCTLNKKENEKQTARFLKEHDEFEPVEEITVFPDEIHDGFYAACMRKKS